jgi:hypothetical protein
VDIAIVFASIIQKTGGLNQSVKDAKLLEESKQKFQEGYRTTNPKTSEIDWKEIDFFINYRRILTYIILKDYWLKKPEADEKLKEMILNS